MQNNIRKAFVAALLAAAAFGVSLAAPGGAAPGMPRPPWAQPDGVATATSVKTTTARLGSLRRDDTVVVAVEGVVADPGVDTNAVRAIVEEYCGTNIVPRVDAMESGLSDVEEWQRTNGLYSAVAELGDSVSAALAAKADGTVVEHGVYSPAMDTNDVWVVDTDGTVLRFLDADPEAGTVTWRGVCASNTLWVSGSTTSAPPEVAYSLTTLDAGAERVLASVDVVDVATGARCGIPRSAFGGTGTGVAYLAPSYDQAGPGDLQYSYTVTVRPLGSGGFIFRRTDSGAFAEVMRFLRGRVVDAETSVVYDADLRRRLAELRAAVVSRDAATSGFTEWVVSAERPVTGEVVVAAFPAGSAPSGLCDWSLFYADDAVRDGSTRLADVKRASSAATNLVWAASETSWGISVTACRVRVPTVADIEGVQAVAGKHYDDASAMFARLLHYATNNYYSAYLANERAKNLEAWQYTNAVGRADVERGMTDWAMTPMWPIGYVDAGQVLDGPDAGKWSLFPTGATHTASNALLPAIDGAKNSFGDVVELLWPDASWRVEERWTNSLDKLGLRWTPDPGDGYVTAHFDARAARTRVVTMEDVYSLSTNMAQTVTGLVDGVSERLDRLGADLASAARLSLPGECFPVTYMAGSSPPVTIGGADGLSFREDGGVVRMGDAASGRYICSFDPGTLRFLESPYGDALLFGHGYSPGASNEWPVLSVAVCGAPVVQAGRTVNGKALTNDVTLTASDVGVSSRLFEDGAVRYVRIGGDEFTVAPAASTALTPATYSDAPAFTEWKYSGLDSRFTVLRGPKYYPQYGGWYCDEVADAAYSGSYEAYARSDDANATNLVMDFEDEWGTNFTFTATRVRTDILGYRLGSQTNKVLASTLAVDRLWDRSTNSFLKAEWETSSGEMLYRLDQNPYSGSIDWRWRWSDGTNWAHSAARFYPWSLEYRDEDYIDLDAGENAGLWIGADNYGGNNITGAGYIGYRKGFVVLGRPGDHNYDEIYFPTGVGAGRDNNVFALTKDIGRATNALYGVVSGALAGKRDYTDLSYDTAETIEAPVIRATVSGNGQSIVADLECNETVPDPPVLNHVYTWQDEAAGLKITQGRGVYTTVWVLYVGGSAVASDETQNATQGFYPDLSFSVGSSGGTVTATKTTAQKTATREDSIALTSQVPAVAAPSTSASDSGKAADAKATGDALARKQDALTFDNAPTAGSNNPVKSGGTWSALWGTASTAFSSLYDWCVAQLTDKRDKTDLAVYERREGVDRWDVVADGTGATTALPLTSTSGISTTYSNGNTYGCYKLVTYDYRQTGGDEFLVTVFRNTGITSIQWAKVTVSPERSTGEITETEAAAQGLRFVHVRQEEGLFPTEDTLAKVSQMNAAIDPLLFAQYYPEGNVKSAAEFTTGIKYGSFDDVHRTVSVLPFCNTGDSEIDNSELKGCVVIPPFVDAQWNPYISDDGTRYKVVGVSGALPGNSNTNLTAVIAPNTVTSVNSAAFYSCASLTAVSLPAVTSVNSAAFYNCTSLTAVSLPAVTIIGGGVFYNCTSLASVDFGDTPRDSVPTLGADAFFNVPTNCKIIVPYTQYDEWIAADGWKDLPQEFVRHAEKADKPVTFTPGNLAEFDANGNPADSGMALDDIKGANVRIGQDAVARQNSVAIGRAAGNRAGDNAVVVGYKAVLGNEGKGGGNNCVVIGSSAQVNSKAQNQKAPSDCMAIGKNAKVYLDGGQFGAVQIGEGVNNEAKSLKFRDTVVVGGDGRIPLSSTDMLDADTGKATFSDGITVQGSGASAMFSPSSSPIVGAQHHSVTFNSDNIVFAATEPGPDVYTYTYPHESGRLVVDTQLVRRYPMFVIDLNPDDQRIWNHFELKASTNNFTNATSTNMLFFTASTVNGVTNAEFDVGYPYDWCRLYVLSGRAGGGAADPRSWTRIRNTAELDTYAPLAVAVIVDMEMLKRGQGSEWLYEDNEEIVWSYLRIGLDSAERDQTGARCWRPVSPVRWYRKLPQWAEQECTSFSTSGIQPYETPLDGDE